MPSFLCPATLYRTIVRKIRSPQVAGGARLDRCNRVQSSGTPGTAIQFPATDFEFCAEKALPSDRPAKASGESGEGAAGGSRRDWGDVAGEPEPKPGMTVPKSRTRAVPIMAYPGVPAFRGPIKTRTYQAAVKGRAALGPRNQPTPVSCKWSYYGPQAERENVGARIFSPMAQRL